MKLNLRFLHIANTATHRNLVHRELDPLAKDMPIETADTTVSMAAEGDGRIDAHVHLIMPGPDIRASASDYTVEAVVRKLGESIRAAWKHRLAKRHAITHDLRLGRSGAH